MFLVDSKDGCAINTNFQRLNHLINQTIGPPWVYPTLNTGYTNYGSGYSPASYYKKAGRVYLKGVVTGDESPYVLFTLPEGHRPPHQKNFSANSLDKKRAVWITTDGRVCASNIVGSFSLDKISFRVT